MSKRPRDVDFTDVPTEIIPLFGSYLPIRDYSAFSETSRALHAQLPTCETLIPQVSSCVANAHLPYPQCKDYCSQYLGAFSLLAMLELCANFRSTSRDNVITPNGDVKLSRFIKRLEGQMLFEYKQRRRTRFQVPLICDWNIENNFDNNTLLCTITYPIATRRQAIVTLESPYPNSVNVEDLIENIQSWFQDDLPIKIVDMKLVHAKMLFFTTNEQLDDLEDILSHPQNVARYNLDSNLHVEEITFDPDFPKLSRFFIPDNVTDEGDDNFGFFTNALKGFNLFFYSDWFSITDKIKQRLIEVFRPL